MKIGPEEEHKVVSFETKKSHFFLQPDTANINLQVLPGFIKPSDGFDAHEGGTKILPISDGISDILGDIMLRGKGLPEEISCTGHTKYMSCLMDVECGWCNGNSGQFCVEG